MINLRKTLDLSHRILSDAKIDHALIGGFAMAVYGHHRSTSDIDLLADGAKSQLIKKIMCDNGFNLTHESPEVLQFTGIGYVDILLANRPLSKEMLTRSKLQNTLNISVVQPEDIIGLKIQAYKNDPSRELQDKADIQKLLSLDNLDLNLVQKYAELFNEWPVIQKLKATK